MERAEGEDGGGVEDGGEVGQQSHQDIEHIEQLYEEDIFGGGGKQGKRDIFVFVQDRPPHHLL